MGTDCRREADADDGGARLLTEAIRSGVTALGFSIVEINGAPWMVAEIATETLAPALARAAAAAISVDKEIALQPRTTPASQARAALMLRLFRSPASKELESYQDLLVLAVTQRVAADPARLLDALAEPNADLCSVAPIA